MIQPQTETEVLLLSITKKCETLIIQTHTKPYETLKFKLTKPKESFSFIPSINLGLDSNWMVGLTSSEAYNYIFNITEENSKLEFYPDNLDEFSFED